MDNKTEINTAVNGNETVINNDIINADNKTELNTEISYNDGDIRKGVCLLDKYTIIEPLNTESGEADLYLCEYYDDIYVAKIYRREVAIKSEVIRAVKNIKSPYIARLYDTGVYENRPFEILPYYKNGSLQGKTFNFQDLKDMIIPCINEALDKLHKIGVIHKDLKPSNIMMLDDNKGVAVIDFGISSVINDGNTVLVTKTGMTPEYSAPETFRNVFLEESDYYSFGITLYELFFGYTPYRNMSAEEITRYMSVQQIPLPDDVPEELKNLLLGLTYSDLTNRNDENNPNRRWTYNEVVKWCEGISQITPGNANSLLTQTGIPAYKFKGKQYTDIDKLAEALISDWDNGKKQLYRGLLSRFFSQYDSEIAGYCIDAEEAVSKFNADEDLTFWKLIYKISPNIHAFYWKDIKYVSLVDFGKEMLELLRANDISKKEFWNEILLNKVISSFMQKVKYPEEQIKGVEAIEASIKINNEDLEKISLNDYLLAYMLSGEKTLVIDNMSFETTDELILKLNEILEQSYDTFEVFCKKLINANSVLEPQFEAWLMLLGKQEKLSEWKNCLLIKG